MKSSFWFVVVASNAYSEACRVVECAVSLGRQCLWAMTVEDGS